MSLPLFTKYRLTKRAEKLLRQGKTIPLDLFAQLISCGVDVTELERKIRNV